MLRLTEQHNVVFVLCSPLSKRRPGFTAIYSVLLMIALCAFVSLAVDYARVQLAKSELLAAVDAAARYASTGLSDSTAVTKAISAAADNKVDGKSLVLTSADVTTGYWNDTTDAFTAGGTPVNAVKISARRSSASGNGIPLLFMSILGRSSCDVSATAIALSTTTTSGPDYGWVGLGWNNHSGGTVVDSYSSASGAYASGTAGNSGLTCNSSLNINGSITIKGDVNYGPSGGISINPPASITGNRTRMTANVSFPTVTVGTYSSSNNNSSISGSGYTFDGTNLQVNSGGVVNFPAGVFYVPNLVVNSGGAINYTATGTSKTVIYTQNFTFSGSQKQNGSTTTLSPANFQLLMYGSGGLNINAQTDFYGDVYAPNTALNISSRAMFGRGVFSGINNSGASFHQDKSLSAYFGTPTGGGGTSSGSSSGTGSISIVR